ncbi:uncharacterized protein LOC129894666 [Solanum dulcamara]|uniref:uncharacterized protein LOC129894666 n=1 Tax=Solanum dulcamara TaxID=45834 RepID=UPI0024860995|nr:uncharacterized protein LOC129894666 [Solanum dulcamara]
MTGETSNINSGSNTTNVTTAVVHSNHVTATTVDFNHPDYLHPSDSPGMNLISPVFDGRGFPGIPDLTSLDFPQWSYCSDMVISWLLNTLSKDIGDSVIYSTTAKELWENLEQRFGKSNGTKLFHLEKELNILIQGNSDISGYFTKMKRIWAELDSLNADIARSNILMMKPLPGMDVAYSLLLQDEN